ncbi:MAG: hypothetical protein KAR47_16605 [Planctomycetes bacterium]|nr:hypothetical protein [Planctomycetota bacterium]
MSDRDGNRARELIRKLNQARREQAKKIDILCNDMVFAHKDVVKQLGDLTFVVTFYESLLGETDLSGLLDRACKLIGLSLEGCHAAVFLLSSEGFEVHIVDDERPIEVGGGQLESCFSGEVVGEICRSSKVCRLEDMIEMGLEGNPKELGGISAVAVPLGPFSEGVGFVLVYRGAEAAITAGEIDKVNSISGGLYRAIESRRQIGSTSGVN